MGMTCKDCFFYGCCILTRCSADADVSGCKVFELESLERKKDLVEVVRCKDCKYQIKEWHPDNRMISKGYYTYGCDRNFHLYSSNAVNGRDNEFCSYGERRTANENL